MLASITPLGERGRGNRWWLTAASYELGSVLGGASAGVAAGAVGMALRDLALGSIVARATLGTALVAVALIAEVAAAAGRSHLPSLRRQVNKEWLDRYRGWVYGLGFGVQLGTGVVTIVNSAATYAFLGLVVVLASPVIGCVVGLVYGAVRAAPLLMFGTVSDFATLQRAHRRLEQLSLGASRLTTGLLALSCLALVAVTVTAR